MYVGVLLDKRLSDNCYGYRFHNNLKKDNDKSGNLFKFYPEQYSAWRDNGIQKAKKLLDDNEDVAILGLDISHFYYSIDFDFEELRDFLNEEYTDDEDIKLACRLTDIVEKICSTYNKKITPQKELTH